VPAAPRTRQSRRRRAATVLAWTAGLSREEWLALRRRGIGSSDAAAAVGLDPYRSPFALWAEKRGEYTPSEPGEAAAWGTRLEPVVAAAWAEETGRRVRRRRAILLHPEFDFALCDLDFYSPGPDGPEIVECKTTGAHNAEDWADGAMPLRVRLQVLHQLAVTGYARAHVAALLGGQRLVVRTVEQDPGAQEDLMRGEAAFWALVEGGTPPGIDGTPSTWAALAASAGSREPAPRVLPPEAFEWVEGYRSAVAAVRAAETARDSYRALICAAMGGPGAAVFQGQRVASWQRESRRGLDVAALRRDHPEIAARYETVTESIVFRLTGGAR
jgi:putative phage-type endonuclease